MRSIWLSVLFVVTGVAGAGEPVKEPALLQELEARTKKDQEARFALIKFQQRTGWSTKPEVQKDSKLAEEYRQLVEKGRAIDAENTKWVKDVVAKHGWPGRSLVGVQGAQHAWLLVQHADHDRPFQKQCLEKMRAMPKGEIDPKNLAYLADRVAVGEGKKQVYGTQLTFKDGKLVPHPAIEDEANVDKRRAEVGLGSLKEYIESAEKVYKGEAPKPKNGP